MNVNSVMLQTILNSAMRAIAAYLLLLIVARFLGRKAISQMTFFDFAVAITLGTLAASIGTGADANPVNSAAVMITLACLGIFTGYLHTKSYLVRKTVDSEPVVLVQNGRIVKDNMQKTRVSINNLTTMLREKDVFNIGDVEFALLENDGKLSVQLKSQKQPLTPSDINIPTAYKGLSKDIIIDGNIMYENLKDAGLDEDWLMGQLKGMGIENAKDIFFAALDTSGSLYVSKGTTGGENHGKYGLD